MENTEEGQSEIRYDVYLSFRGDTRCSFAGNLYNALCQKRFRTFMRDKRTESGDQISPSLSKAIEQSRISIVVFSQDYAWCKWGLDELVKIVECMKTKNQLVWPIFYRVKPSNVKKQEKSYGDAMAQHEKKFGKDSEKVQKWRSALSEVADLPTNLFEGYEYKYIQGIVEKVTKFLPRYDIFIGFRGVDTRYSFAGFLNHALHREGFKTFMDDKELEGGDQISSRIIGAIEISRLSIVILSENYAYSSWCLDELVHILECMKTKNQLVYPIFYKVNPSDVRHQKNSYHKAMIAHEKRIEKDSEKLLKWRSALSKVADLKGWHLQTDQYEFELIEKVVKEAIDKDNSLCIPSPHSSPASSSVE